MAVITINCHHCRREVYAQRRQVGFYWFNICLGCGFHWAGLGNNKDREYWKEEWAKERAIKHAEQRWAVHDMLNGRK